MPAPAKFTKRPLFAVAGIVAVVVAAIVGGSIFAYNHAVTPGTAVIASAQQAASPNAAHTTRPEPTAPVPEDTVVREGASKNSPAWQAVYDEGVSTAKIVDLYHAAGYSVSDYEMSEMDDDAGRVNAANARTRGFVEQGAYSPAQVSAINTMHDSGAMIADAIMNLASNSTVDLYFGNYLQAAKDFAAATPA